MPTCKGVLLGWVVGFEPKSESTAPVPESANQPAVASSACWNVAAITA